ncbi:MAG: serine/threonine protein kinase [Deltaproteobacteria bacterium]|nr:serine/threonine protein kinase [Deltaproteobacteria bacterium]
MVAPPRQVGKYEILERLGSGGMAEVFRARTTDARGHERLVAIKRLSEELSRDPSLVEMFLDEARLAAQLAHPSIVGLEEFGSDGDGRAFMVLEYVEGHDLRWCLAVAAQARFWLPVEFSLSVVREICHALAYAHEARDRDGRPLQLVHRDVSHSNVFLSTHGEVKLADFGIARARGRQSRTRTGMVKGKLGYLSPEQVRAEPLDRRTDIFAATVVLWELLTQRRMFSGPTEFKTMVAVCIDPRFPPSHHRPGLPPELDRVVLRGVAIEKEDRYETAAELAEAIDRVAERYGLDLGPRIVSEVVRYLANAEDALARAGLEEGFRDLSPTELLEPFAEPTEVAPPDPEPSDMFAHGDSSAELEITVEATLPGEQRSVLELVQPASDAEPHLPTSGVRLTPYVTRAALAGAPFDGSRLEIRRGASRSPVTSFAALIRALDAPERTLTDTIAADGRASMPLDRFARLAELEVGAALRTPASDWTPASDLELVGLIGDLTLRGFIGRLLVAEGDQQRACLFERGGLVGLVSSVPGEQLAVALVTEARGKDAAALLALLKTVVAEGVTIEAAASSTLGFSREAVGEARLGLALEVLADVISFPPKQITREATSGWPGRGFFSDAPLELVLPAAAAAWSEASLDAALSAMRPQRLLIRSGLPPLIQYLGLRESSRPVLEALQPGRTIAELIDSFPAGTETSRLAKRLLLIFVATGAIHLR